MVDDGSSDATKQIAVETGVSVLANKGQSGTSAARARGVAASSSSHVIFVDADVVVYPNVKSIIATHFANDPHLKALFGSYDADPSAESTVSFYRNFLNHFVNQKNDGLIESFWAGFGIVKRDVFEQLGGFNSEFDRFEDVEFGSRLVCMGARIRRPQIGQIQS